MLTQPPVEAVLACLNDMTFVVEYTTVSLSESYRTQFVHVAQIELRMNEKNSVQSSDLLTTHS